MNHEGKENLSNLSLSELTAKKKEIKQTLIQFDCDFAKKNGSMPLHDEKECIRDMYEKYTVLKRHIIQKKSIQLLGRPPKLEARMLNTVLTTLRAEKRKLRLFLKSYETKFYLEHQRNVSTFQDIRPVAEKYRRYEEIKAFVGSLRTESELAACRVNAQKSFGNNLSVDDAGKKKEGHEMDKSPFCLSCIA